MTNPREARSVASGWGCALACVAAVLAAASYLVSVNEHVAMQGEQMAGAYDCDGPGSVLLLSVPSFVLAAGALVASGRALRTRRSPAAIVALLLSLIVVDALALRAPAVLAEWKKNAAPGSPCL